MRLQIIAIVFVVFFVVRWNAKVNYKFYFHKTISFILISEWKKKIILSPKKAWKMEKKLKCFERTHTYTKNEGNFWLFFPLFIFSKLAVNQIHRSEQKTKTETTCIYICWWMFSMLHASNGIELWRELTVTNHIYIFFSFQIKCIPNVPNNTNLNHRYHHYRNFCEHAPKV